MTDSVLTSQLRRIPTAAGWREKLGLDFADGAVPSRTNFWTNIDEGFGTPKIYRFRQRVFVGNYASADGAQAAQSGDVWLGTSTVGPNYILRDAHLAVANEGGWIAIGGAAATSQDKDDDFAMGGGFYGDADTAGGVAWAIYAEAILRSGADWAVGQEIDVRNADTDIVPTAYSIPAGAYGLMIATGPGDGSGGYGPAAVADTAAALVIRRNASGSNSYSFNKGIIFKDDAVKMTGSVGTAIEMALGHQVVWDSPDGTTAFRIRSDLGDSDVDWTQYLSGDTVVFARNAGTEPVLVLRGGASSNADWIELRNVTGAPQILAVGGSTNNDVNLVAKGTGIIRTNTSMRVQQNVAIPAGGTAGAGYRFFSTANFGIFGGSGAPTLSAAKGSLYLRSDGSGTTDRAYINTDGGTTWTALTTVA